MNRFQVIYIIYNIIITVWKTLGNCKLKKNMVEQWVTNDE